MAKPFLTRATEGRWAVVEGTVRFELDTFSEAKRLLQDAVELGGLDIAFYGPEYDEGPSCSICDALGHGYPGGRPCPLEDGGYWDARAEEEDEARRGVIGFQEAWDLAGR